VLLVKTRFLEGRRDSGGRRCRQYRRRTPPSAQHDHRLWLDIASMAKAHLHDQRPSVAHALGGRPDLPAQKPSRRAIASSARRSRPSSTWTMNTCISRKARRTC
jgi:hypothetical protein